MPFFRLCFFIHIIATSAFGAPSCRSVVARVGMGGLHVAGAGVYPVMMTFAVASEIPRLFTASGRRAARANVGGFFKETWKHGLGYLAILGVNLSATLPTGQFLDDTQDMEAPRPDDVIVYVNGAAAGTADDEVNRNFFARKYRGNSRAVMIRATSHDQLVSELKYVRALHGPVTKMDVFTHGYPGGFYLGDKGDGIDGAKAQPGIFAKDAKVRVLACMSGSGEKGDRLGKEIGRVFLERGGEVAMSRVIVNADGQDYLPALIRFTPPAGYDSATRYAAPIINAVVPAFTNLKSELTSGPRYAPWTSLYVWGEKVKRTQIAPIVQ